MQFKSLLREPPRTKGGLLVVFVVVVVVVFADVHHFVRHHFTIALEFTINTVAVGQFSTDRTHNISSMDDLDHNDGDGGEEMSEFHGGVASFCLFVVDIAARDFRATR